MSGIISGVFGIFDRPGYNLTHGNTASSIVGFGDVVIMIEYGDKQREFTLKEVAYIPGFYTNLVCFARLKHADFANLLPSGSFWVMSRSTICPAQPNRAQFYVNAVNSRKDYNVVATDVVWHKTQGHIDLDAVRHLPQATQHVVRQRAASQNDSSLCETCVLAKIKE
ncbi:hypothetical protein V1509DRAFT_647388 [Lipomyces kononenkoae]